MVQVTASLPDVPGLRAAGPAFHREFAAVCDRLQIDADAIAALISHESAFNGQAFNKLGGASGIMQWMPATAKWLGTTTEAIRAMSALEQLKLVEKTFKGWAGKLSARDVPMVGFGASFIGKPDSHVAYAKGQKGYDWNTGLDINRDGKLTLGEVRDHVLAVLGPAKSKPRIPVPGREQPPPAPPGEPTDEDDRGLYAFGFFALAACFYFASKGGR